ncbi:hypothetical protein HWN40_06225 [Methanolobus zinderi]|uniref:Uncharacterized protein n=1 Tax=Methanolobus zinderi TaxID=536044 RepID=A0A7D5E6E1_9EURY|nr:hypothetical protein [Methanolobus zinderi]QLC49872.1 hypothetical protein HWN40_06225 [Methanolobus zinderi]
MHIVVKKLMTFSLLAALVLISGCTDTTTEPVDSENVFLEASPVILKEFQEQDISIIVTNNATQALEAVKVTGFTPLSVVGAESVNIEGRTGTEPMQSSLNAKVSAPSFETDQNDSALTISYLSGSDSNGKQSTGTKSITVPVTILPDAKLQFVGFVEDMDSLSTPAAESWELRKGENATIKFSVRNDGETTIPGGVLTVVADVDNKLIADQASVPINQSMARKGTSYTKGLQIPINGDAPNGETDVIVKLMYGDMIVDEQTLVLKVKL